MEKMGTKTMEHGHGGGGLPTWAVVTMQFLAVFFVWIEDFLHIGSEVIRDVLPLLQLIALIIAIATGAKKLFAKPKLKTNDDEDNG